MALPKEEPGRLSSTSGVIGAIRAVARGKRLRDDDRALREQLFLRTFHGEVRHEETLMYQEKLAEGLGEMLGMPLSHLALPKEWFAILSEGYSAELFKNPRQAESSDHNLFHGFTVATISYTAGEYLNTLHKKDPKVYPYHFSKLELLALVTAGLLHDTQRNGDVYESIAHIKQHMIEAAEKAPTMLQREEFAQLKKLVEHYDGDYNDFSDLVSELCLHHGSETGPISEDALKRHPHIEQLSELIAFADAKTLQRLFISFHRTAKMTAGYINETRNHLVLQTIAEEDPSHAQKVSEAFRLLGTLLDVSSKHFAKGDFSPEHQKEVFGMLLERFGLINEEEALEGVRRVLEHPLKSWEEIRGNGKNLIAQARAQMSKLFDDIL